jgi:uncharacterized protein GlcG (DUF336 family)
MPRIFTSQGQPKTGQEARYASIYVNDGASAQGSISTTPAKVTGFAANGPSNDSTPDHTNDQITIVTGGAYLVAFQVSFSGTVSTSFTFKLRIDAVESTLGCTRVLGTGGDLGSASFSGILNLSASEVLTIYVESAVGSGNSITPADMQLSVIEIAPAVSSGGVGLSGPGSSTDEAIARWDGTGGKLLQDSAMLVDDSGNITGVGNITLSGTLIGTLNSASLTIDGGTL